MVGLFRYLLAVFCLLACLLPGPALAETPAEKLDSYLQKVFQIFQDYDSASISQEEQLELKQRLSDVAGEIFEYSVMARMSLARHWQELSAEQQQEFVRVFRQLLEANYFDKVLTYLEEIARYTPENVAITDEIVFTERKAEVQTSIAYEGKTVPVNYRFVKLKAGWQIYDISVEGVSLVQNYRSQFGEALAGSTPQELLDRLRAKVESGGSDAQQ